MMPRPGRRLRAAAFKVLVPVASAVLAPLPWPAVLAAGRVLGLLLYALNGRERRRMREHLALAFPDVAAAERERLARRCARHHGMNLAENLHLLRRGPRRILPRIAVEGWQHLEAVRQAGRRILLLTGHCGNWELFAPVAAERGLRLVAMARQLDDPTLHEGMLELRRTLGGVETIVRGEPAAGAKLRRILRGEAAFVVLIDQDTRVEGAWVPFFGRSAYTPLAAAQMAGRHDMTVVPYFCERREDGTHLCRVLPALDLPDDPIAATALMTATIEAQIRRRPEQWVWMHRRWRRQP